jgi:uncharacterized phage protein (TIGR02218 family)
MKAISVGLDSHLNQTVTTIATCWKATLENASVYGFTSHTGDIVISGVTYQASTGYTPTAVASNADLAVDNLDVVGFLDWSRITDADIQSGLWDHAAIEIFQVNYLDLTLGSIPVRAGKIGEIKTSRLQFVAELRGMAQQLQQDVGQIYSASCRANLGDTRCGVDLGAITVTGSVTTATSSQTFTDTSRAEADGYFDNGLMTMTSGDNIGLSMEIKTFLSDEFVLQLPFPYAIALTDTYSAYPGCKKRFVEDCQTKFNNVLNFRGEPHVPGVDQLGLVGGG